MSELIRVTKMPDRKPIRLTRKPYCMTGRVAGVSPRWHGGTRSDGKAVTHLADWRILDAFEQSMGYAPAYAGEIEEWQDTPKGKKAIKAMNEREETEREYQRRYRAWQKRQNKADNNQ